MQTQAKFHVQAAYIPKEFTSGSGTKTEATIHVTIAIKAISSPLLNSIEKIFFITKNL